MVARGALIAVVIASLGACARPTAPLTVPQAIAQIRALNGKTVRVMGYLGECAGYECALYVDRAGFDASERWFADLRARTRPTSESKPTGPMPPPPPSFGIGSDNGFDAKAAPFQNSMVVITGTVTDECRGPDGQPGCTDRSTDLNPTAIASLKDK